MGSQLDQQRISVKVDRKIWQDVGEYAKKMGMTKSQFVAYSLLKCLGERTTIIEKDNLITEEEKDFLNQLLQASSQSLATKEE